MFVMSSLRFTIAGGLLYAWSIRRGRHGRRPAGSPGVGCRGRRRRGAVPGRERRRRLGREARRHRRRLLIIAAVPLWMALFDRAVCGQRLSRTAVIGLALGFGGVALLAWPSGPSHIDVARRDRAARRGRGLGGGIALLAPRAASRGGRSSARACRCSPAESCWRSSAAATGEMTDVHDVSTTSILALLYLIVFGSWLAFTVLRVAAPQDADVARLDLRVRQPARRRLPRLGGRERVDERPHRRRGRRDPGGGCADRHPAEGRAGHRAGAGSGPRPLASLDA